MRRRHWRTPRIELGLSLRDHSEVTWFVDELARQANQPHDVVARALLEAAVVELRDAGFRQRVGSWLSITVRDPETRADCRELVSAVHAVLMAGGAFQRKLKKL